MKKVLILFSCIVIFRLWFAFSHLTFGQDFARDLYLSQESLDQGITFVDYGPKASVGNFYLPPFYYQLLLVLTAITTWPLFITAVITIAESITPILLFYILRSFTKKETALLGAVVYAFSGLAINFGTFAWNPNMIPFFTTLALLLISSYIKERKAWQLIFSLLSITLAFQLHYQVTVIVPFYLFVSIYLLFKKHFIFSHWLAAILIALIPFFPYFYAESANNFTNTKEIVKYFSVEHARYFDRVSKVSYPTTFIPSFVERELTKVNFPQLWLGRSIFFIGMCLFFYQTKKNKQLHIFFYFLLALIFLRFYKGDKLDYYLSTIFILPSILVATIIEKNKLLGTILAAIILIASGVALGKVPTQNQVVDLELTMLALNEKYSGSSVRLIVHDIDFANTVLYGLEKYTSITVDQDAPLVLDVCRKKTDCLASNLFCTKDASKMAIFSSVLRTSGGYSLLNSTTESSLPFQLHIGQFETKPADISNPISHTYDRYGTDIINPKIFSD